MCYPYVYFWALLLRRSPQLAPKRGAGLCPFPCLYMYGDKKPRQFHSDVRVLERTHTNTDTRRTHTTQILARTHTHTTTHGQVFSYACQAFLFAVSKRADSRVAKFAAGHWFLVGKEADQVNETVAKWLGERYAAPSPSL